ncbi:MAG: TonB-dependent receptor domain-containing protein [Thiohalospira sp.]
MPLYRAVLVALLTLFIALPVAAQEEDEPAWLSVMAFRDSRPAGGLEVRIDGEAAGRLDRLGYFETRVAPGEHTVVLRDEREEILRRRLDAEADDDIRLTVNLAEGAEATAEITAAGGSGELLSETETETEPGRVTGRVVDSEEETPVAEARVLVRGTAAEARTDEDGRFELEVPAGERSLSVVHGDYSTRNLSAVTVPPEETESLGDVALTPAGLDLGEVVVSAPYVEGSVASAVAEQRDAGGVSEILGADQMSRSGDSSAADALTRVTGLTIEDGKYVVVRGQPARYTETLLNGSPLPSPDPLKSVVPLDLFPTGILAGIDVEKSYDAARPGAFGAGLVDLRTAGVPDEGYVELSAGTGYNSLTTGSEIRDHTAGGSDWLATDDGTRDVPAGVSGADDLEEAGQAFSNDWEPKTTTGGPDQSLGAEAGARTDLAGGEFGLRAGVDWSRESRLTETVERDYSLAGDGSLRLRDDQLEERSETGIDLGASLIAAQEWDDHTLRSNTFLLRKATRRTEVTEGTRAVSNDYYIRDTLLEWTERELLSQQFAGEHDLDWLQADWRAMFSESRWEQPDRRDYRYRRSLSQGDDADMIFDQQNGARRRFSESEDSVTGFDLDLTAPVFDGQRLGVELRGGASYQEQERSARVERYRLEPEPGVELSLPPEEILDPDRIGDTLKIRDDSQSGDNYDGEATVTATYLGTKLDWTEALTLNAGVRQETADFQVRPFENERGTLVEGEVAGAFEETRSLPAAGLTWRFVEGMQLRANIGRSVSRPLLNELNPGRYYDPDSGEEFMGNPDLEPAEIASRDLRWEWYPGSDQLLSLGWFEKDYTNPLEESFVGVGGSSYLRRIQNADGASVTGWEFNGITDLEAVAGRWGGGAGWMDDLSLQANAALIDSSVELARQDLATSADRSLQGQADVVYNLQAGYDGERHDFNLALNHVGERLQIAGVQGQPDVYQEPVTYLDLTWGWEVGGGVTLKLKGGNLLDTETTLLQGDEVYRESRKGRDIGLSVSYRPGG